MGTRIGIKSHGGAAGQNTIPCDDASNLPLEAGRVFMCGGSYCRRILNRPTLVNPVRTVKRDPVYLNIFSSFLFLQNR